MGSGKGCAQNDFAATNWFRRAASQGNLKAKVNLGILLKKGTGVEQVDHEQANALFQEAIEGGSIDALHSMGLSHFYANGVEENRAMALSYWHRAADLGLVQAATNVGQAYWKGMGGYAKSLKLARKYMKASAAQGDTLAIACLKEMTACAQCGTGSAPRVCAGCKQVHYCNKECQLLHWRDPSDPHELHCGSCRRDVSGASSSKPPCAEKTESDRACAACGAHGAKMLCSDCLYGEVPLKVRLCNAACQLVHWHSPTDPHKARCTGCDGLYDEEAMTKKEFQIERNARHADLKRASKPPASAPAPAPARGLGPSTGSGLA